MLDGGHVFFQRRGERAVRYRVMAFLSFLHPVFDEADDALGVLVEAVVAQFILHIKRDQDATRQPGGQPKDVDEGIHLILFQIAKRNLEIVLQHSLTLVLVPGSWIFVLC